MLLGGRRRWRAGRARAAAAARRSDRLPAGRRLHRANKVDSPQYALWLVPLAVLARPRWASLLIWQVTEVVLGAANLYTLIALDHADQGLPLDTYLIVVVIRDVVLCGLMALVVRDVLVPSAGRRTARRRRRPGGWSARSAVIARPGPPGSTAGSRSSSCHSPHCGCSATPPPAAFRPPQPVGPVGHPPVPRPRAVRLSRLPARSRPTSTSRRSFRVSRWRCGSATCSPGAGSPERCSSLPSRVRFAMVALARLGALEGWAGGRLARGPLPRLSPYAVFLAAGYSESLFLAFALSSWLAARRGRWLAAGAARRWCCVHPDRRAVPWRGARRRVARDCTAVPVAHGDPAGRAVAGHGGLLRVPLGCHRGLTGMVRRPARGLGAQAHAALDRLAHVMVGGGVAGQGSAYEWSFRAEIAAILLGVALTVALLAHAPVGGGDVRRVAGRLRWGPRRTTCRWRGRRCCGCRCGCCSRGGRRPARGCIAAYLAVAPALMVVACRDLHHPGVGSADAPCEA